MCLWYYETNEKLKRIQRKKIDFINRLKYAEKKITWIYKDVSKKYQVDDFNGIFNVSSRTNNSRIIS